MIPYTNIVGDHYKLLTVNFYYNSYKNTWVLVSIRGSWCWQCCIVCRLWM